MKWTPARLRALKELHAITMLALDRAFPTDGRTPDPTLLRRLYADGVAKIHEYRARRWGHQRGVRRSAETRQKIADAAKIISATKQRDTRGRFAL